MKKRVLCLLLITVLVSTMIFAAGNNESSTADAKGKVKFYGKVIEYTSGPKMSEKTQEILADKYDIEMIQVDWSNLTKVIRTGITANEPCDVYNFPAESMDIFKEQAVDLTPYLEANGGEWKNQFNPDILEKCKVDGKIVCIPWELNAPVLLANKEILDKAGVTVPEMWTMEEFYVACEKIKAAGYFPFATPMDLAQAGWLYRNMIQTATVAEGSNDEFVKGDLSFKGEETKKALEAIKTIYDNDYAYPGKGAVTVKKDEIQAAYQQGKIAIIANVAAGASQLAKNSSFEVVTVPWPTLCDKSMISGIAINAFFIPKNAANIEGAVEAIKTFTSPEVMAIHAQEGYIPANNKVEIESDFVKGLVKLFENSGNEYVSTPMIEYYNNNLIPDLVLNGGVEFVQNELEKIRLEDKAN